MTPEKYAEVGTEHAHQVALFMWSAQNRECFPELEWFFAIPNGGERNIAVATRLVAEGSRSGVSDTMLPVARKGYHGLFIEMKKPKGKESAKQKDFGAFLKTQDYFYCCCDHWEKARDTLLWYFDAE
jgi:hypothetical protein